MWRLLIFYVCTLKWMVNCCYFKNIANIHVSRFNIYDVKQMSSIIRCSYFCDSNPIIGCTRFMWSDATKTCMLHSEEQAGLPVVLPGDASWFVNKLTNFVCNSDTYDYDLYTNSCVRLAEDTLGKTWMQARTSCQSDGGDLISITTRTKLDFVLDYINNTLVDGAWIGFRSNKWLTGDSFQAGIFNGGILNNDDGGYPDDPDKSCGRIYKDGSVSDNSCNMRTRKYYICEILV